MIEIISSKAFQNILSYFSNPVSEFSLTYHSEFIAASEDSASGGTERTAPSCHRCNVIRTTDLYTALYMMLLLRYAMSAVAGSPVHLAEA